MKSIYIYLLAILIGGFVSCNEPASKVEELPETEVNTKADDGWKRVSTGTMGLSVECPFEFKETNLRTEIDPEINHLISKMETYMHTANTSVYMLNSVEYQPEVEVSLTGAIDGGINSMVQTVQGTLLSRNDVETTVSGNKGVLTTGTVSSPAGTFYIQNTTLNIGQKLYQIMGINMVEDKTGEADIKRFIESAQIK